jgi:hypothetical protein
MRTPTASSAAVSGIEKGSVRSFMEPSLPWNAQAGKRPGQNRSKFRASNYPIGLQGLAGQRRRAGGRRTDEMQSASEGGVACRRGA